MAAVRDGAFDPGPPPEPVRDLSAPEADTKPTEDLRERALRRIREDEARQKAGLEATGQIEPGSPDWYQSLLDNADDGDAAQESSK